MGSLTKLDYRAPTGYQQVLNATLQSAAGLAPPAKTCYAMIQANGGAVRWRDDGTNPTATIGMLLPAGGELDCTTNLNAIKFIAASGTPVLDINYYQ